jgi:phosphatidate cytidylyltransferase
MSLAVAWLNDTCAYFSGYFFGKRKLCPEISPKKTVEGAIGGVFGDVIVSCILAFVFSVATGYSVNWISFVIFVPIGAVIAILGDLCASIIKRQLGIKDYGKIMPGHGGIMDRFDSWIFVAPVLYIWNLCFPFIG